MSLLRLRRWLRGCVPLHALRPWSLYVSLLRIKLQGDSEAIRLPGMTLSDRLTLYHFAQRLPKNAVAVEVGSYLGSSAAVLSAALKRRGGNLYCVDTWQNNDMSEGSRDTYSEFLRNIEPWSDRIIPLRGFSTEVASSFEHRIDFLFIDAEHTYEGVRADADAWLPKVRPGAVVIFHDYPNAPGVVRVIKELAQEGQITEGRNQQRCYMAHKAK